MSEILIQNDFYQYDKVCWELSKKHGIRFAAIINKRGRKIAGGFGSKITPLENDEKRMEMLFMELALDLSMRSEFNNTLGTMRAIVSFRDKTTIITIPHGDDFLLVSAEPELDALQVIRTACQILYPGKITEVLVH